jgi:hypothetical protein
VRVGANIVVGTPDVRVPIDYVGVMFQGVVDEFPFEALAREIVRRVAAAESVVVARDGLTTNGARIDRRLD